MKKKRTERDNSTYAELLEKTYGRECVDDVFDLREENPNVDKRLNFFYKKELRKLKTVFKL